MRIKRLKTPNFFIKKVAGATLLGLLMLSPLQADTLWGETRKVEASKSELIATFAREHGLAAEHVAWANGLAPTVRVAAGDQLTLPARILPNNPPEDGIVVNLAERGGYVYSGGEFVGFVPVSIGSEEKDSYHTPSGNFEIISRVENPEWHAPESDWAEAMEKDRIDADSEENPLGEYWFGFNAPTGGYGFHENTAPAYTGDTVSHGCLRLYPKDAKMLYQKKLLQPGDTVTVVNRPVRVSQDENGDTYLAVFPGVYEKSDLKKEMKAELARVNLDDFFDQEKLEKMAQNPSGIPQRLLEHNVTLSKDGEVLNGNSKALNIDGKVVMPTSALEKFDVEVGYNAESQKVTLTRKEKTVEFELGASGDIRSYRLGDRSYVNATDVLNSFDIPYRWNGDDKTLNIEESI